MDKLVVKDHYALDLVAGGDELTLLHSAKDLFELISRRAPEHLDLLTAQTQDQFDEAVDVFLEKAIAHLERSKTQFANLDEVGLTAVIVGMLDMTPGLHASQEQHSNGHVDITIDGAHCATVRRRLGEAKIYRGPAYHKQGIEQLLVRYTTGREGRGFLLVYVKQQEIASCIRKLREALDQDLPLKQKGSTRAHILKWSFLSTHEHSCGDDLDLCHLGCNLYVEVRQS